MDNPETPYLSIILAVRNDNYGGDFNQRLENMLKWNIHFFEHYEVQIEFILVNYNPVLENSPLFESVQFPENRKYCSIRMITVTSDIHQKYSDPKIRKIVPVYEYIAKNAGIRRAKGEFILSANPDVLFHPFFIKWLSQRPLKKDHYYRVDRCDFTAISEIQPEKGNENLDRIFQNIFKIFLKGQTVNVPVKSFGPKSLSEFRVENGNRIKHNFWLLQNLDYANKNSLSVNYDNITDRFHCNCAGDFFLMHRDHWISLKAYPENTFLSIHTDALFVIVAAAAGMTEIELDWPVFHQDHERRYSGEDDKRNEEIRKMFRLFVKEGEKMLNEGNPRIFNDEFWGLHTEILKEEIF